MGHQTAKTFILIDDSLANKKATKNLTCVCVCLIHYFNKQLLFLQKLRKTFQKPFPENYLFSYIYEKRSSFNVYSISGKGVQYLELKNV